MSSDEIPLDERLRIATGKVQEIKTLLGISELGEERESLLKAKQLMTELQDCIEVLSDEVDKKINIVNGLVSISDAITEYFKQLKKEKGEEK